MKWFPLFCLVLVGCDEPAPPVILPSNLTAEEKLQRHADSNDAPGRFLLVNLQAEHTGNWQIYKIDTITGRTWQCYNFNNFAAPQSFWLEIKPFSTNSLDLQPVK
jgi:hypothetical protein